MYSQNKKIRILSADHTNVDPNFPGATISFGNVFIEHEGATLKCDRAYIYQETKFIKAMGNVIINQGDTVFQYSKYTDYDGINRVSKSWGNVLVKDKLMELRTDTLHFNRDNQHLFYESGGTIKDSINVLTSKIGNYYLRENKFQAFSDVEVTNEENNLVSNHLDYYTDSGISKLYGPSTITGTSNSIYTERGHFNSKTNISYFIKNSKIFYNDRTIEGDSLYHNKNIDFASATGNIRIIDTLNNTVIRGGYAEIYKAKDSVFITKKAVAISTKEKDSLFIHGNKLMITGPKEDRLVRIFNYVKLFKSDLQGKCDSLVTTERIGLTEMLGNPVLWAQENQITGDTIHLISDTKTDKLDSLKIMYNGFMIKQDSAGFNQVKGKNMFGKFMDNKLKTLDIVGNSEVIFYGRDEEEQKLVGITKMRTSKNIFITLGENQIETIDFFVKPDGTTYPPSQYPEQERLFRGFIWRESERPKTKYEIFIRDDETGEKETENKENVPLEKEDIPVQKEFKKD